MPKLARMQRSGVLPSSQLIHYAINAIASLRRRSSLRASPQAVRGRSARAPGHFRLDVLTDREVHKPRRSHRNAVHQHGQLRDTPAACPPNSPRPLALQGRNHIAAAGHPCARSSGYAGLRSQQVKRSGAPARLPPVTLRRATGHSHDRHRAHDPHAGLAITLQRARSGCAHRSGAHRLSKRKRRKSISACACGQIALPHVRARSACRPDPPQCQWRHRLSKDPATDRSRPAARAIASTIE
jgi:hypothetical protein